MPNIDVTVPHNLSEAEALRRIRNLLEQIRSQYGDKVSDLREEWIGNTGVFEFNAMGFAVSGQVQAAIGAVRITGTLPFAATFFKGTIEQTIKEEAARILA